MNAIAVVLILLTAILAFTAGFPAVEDFRLEGLQLKVNEETEDFMDIESEEEESRLRLRRATCDLLSVSTPWGSLNHSACAAHCLAMRKGYRGGRCKSGVCHCRK